MENCGKNKEKEMKPEVTAKAEPTAEVPASKTPKRDKFMQRFKDRRFADDEELFGQIDDDYTGAEENAKTVSDLNDMLSKNPRSATFLSSLVNGEDPVMTYLKEYGQDALAELQTEEGQKKAAKAHEEYLDRVSENKAMEQKYAENILKSQEVVDQYRKEGKDVDKALELLDKAYKAVLVGEITPEMLDMALASVNHDADVASASADAEIKGRNAQIESKMKRAKAGDGLPSMGGATASMPKPKNDAKMGALGNAGKPSIWDRG